MLLGRSDRGLLAQWWFTVDRGLMFAVLLLMASGVLVSMAASPPVAERIGIDTFHFIKGQLFYLGFAVPVLVALSFFPPRLARRAGLAVFFGALVLMVAGAVLRARDQGCASLDQRRAGDAAALGIRQAQPSSSWWPGSSPSIRGGRRCRGRSSPSLMAVLFIGLLVMQPDFGQTALVILTFGAMLLIYGISWIAVLGWRAGGAGHARAYALVPHVQSRVDRF
jgi:cell division protein FtsW